ncbi:META domain-containing protein [Flammeovirgaceae bacterium SG7u.111]|nr:META domain-containing protein [Flammeovirgaceae bacterium SG7u.132]WPO33928.1 META domain-containing protein [Flammeovirgaceae bacterium SG7u.111]
MKNHFWLMGFIALFIASCSQSQQKKETPAEANTAPLKADSTQIPPSMTGIELAFKAQGNEPFWNVTMDFEKEIVFKTMDGLELHFPAVKGNKAQDAPVTRYAAETETARIVITIKGEECSDTMADTTYRNSVRVELKQGEETEYTTYEGCGNFQPDYKLHDIWVMIEANGDTLDPKDFERKGLPMFEFYSKEERLSGHAGCNHFNGSFYVAEPGVLQIGMGASTQMMCPNMTIENLVNQKLFGKRMKYKVANLRLTLTGYDGSSFVFKKVD